MIPVMNKYRVITPALAAEIGRDRRLRIQGAILGGGIPLLLAAVSYWIRGWSGIGALALLGAGVGTVMGWRSAERAATTASPASMAVMVGAKGALAGSCAYGAVSAVAIAAFTMNVWFAAVFAALVVVAGVVVGSVLGVPVALLSVFLLRGMGGDGRRAKVLATALLAACLVVGGAAVLDFAVNGPARLKSDLLGTAQTIELFA